jgi:hypothetical protein
VFILKGLQVVCFVTLLQVLILINLHSIRIGKNTLIHLDVDGTAKRSCGVRALERKSGVKPHPKNPQA